MTNEELNQELNEQIVPLTDEELADIAGGKHSFIEGDDGKSHVRTGPGLGYKSIGILPAEMTPSLCTIRPLTSAASCGTRVCGMAAAPGYPVGTQRRSSIDRPSPPPNYSLVRRGFFLPFASEMGLINRGGTFLCLPRPIDKNIQIGGASL